MSHGRHDTELVKLTRQTKKDEEETAQGPSHDSSASSSTSSAKLGYVCCSPKLRRRMCILFLGVFLFVSQEIVLLLIEVVEEVNYALNGSSDSRNPAKVGRNNIPSSSGYFRSNLSQERNAVFIEDGKNRITPVFQLKSLSSTSMTLNENQVKVWPACLDEQYTTTTVAATFTDFDTAVTNEALMTIVRTISFNDFHFDLSHLYVNPHQDIKEKATNIVTKAIDRLLLGFHNLPNNLPNHLNASEYYNSYVDNHPYSIKNYPTNALLVPLKGLKIEILPTNTPDFDPTILRHGIDESYQIHIPGISIPSSVTFSSTDVKTPLVYDTYFGKMINMIHAETSQNDYIFGNSHNEYAKITATNVYGIINALQSLRLLIEFGWSTTIQTQSIRTTTSIWETFSTKDELENHQPTFLMYDTPITIIDAPRYSYRGLMIDTSRHFIPLSLIRQNLHAMEMNKLNVLHWHVTDRDSWPYLSLKYPELVQKNGAYCLACVYTVQDIQDVIQDAADRGIRTIIEIDLPGHTKVIRNTHPELMTDCNGELNEPLDVTKEEVYEFVHNLYDEIASNLVLDATSSGTSLYDTTTRALNDNEVKAQTWIHVGGDEVPLDCWQNSPTINEWMKQHNIGSPMELLYYFELDLLNYSINKLNMRPIVWQELFQDSNYNDPNSLTKLPKETIVDVWKIWDFAPALTGATNLGYDVIFSACFYLDYLHINFDDEFYNCRQMENHDQLNGQQKKHILGGHACMWAEKVDESNFLPLIWPRTSAMAERLWTDHAKTKAGYNIIFQTRIERVNHLRCYMIQQYNIAVTPLGPGTC